MKLFKKLENMFSASAFAEAGEFDTAREMASEDTGDGQHPVVKGAKKLQHKDQGSIHTTSTSA